MVHGRQGYPTRGAPPPLSPLLDDKPSLTGASRQGDALKTWSVETPKSFITRAQGRCRAAKEAMNDVLSRRVEEALSRNEGAYRDDTPVTEVRQLGFTNTGEVYRGPNSVAIGDTLHERKGVIRCKQIN